MIELLPTADITVALSGQKEGKKNGYVKDESGQFYSVPPNLLTQLPKGARAKVEYKPFGDDGRSVTKIIGNGSAAPVTAKHNYQAQKTPSESRLITIMAMLKCFKPLECGDREGLQANVDVCAAVYDRSFSGRQHRDDMDDSVNF